MMSVRGKKVFSERAAGRVAQSPCSSVTWALRPRDLHINPKRVFDLAVTVLASAAWVPVLLISGLAILLFDGMPVLYVSRRRVYRNRSLTVVKFRTMQRDAARIANRATIPVVNGVRFLNIPSDCPLYTPVGSLVERCCFTELPQLLHVLAGHMSLVGNRPLPEDVIAAIREAHPQVEDRFLTPAGLTGPVQLTGRERLTDEQRLRIEILYCRVAQAPYSMRLDFLILLYTVLVVARVRRPFSCAEIERLLSRFDQESMPATEPQENVGVLQVEAEANQVRPPPRYSDATLVSAKGGTKLVEDDTLPELMAVKALGTRREKVREEARGL